MGWSGWDTVQPARNAAEVERMETAEWDGHDKTSFQRRNTPELEISEEAAQTAFVSPNLTFGSNTTSSSSAKEERSLMPRVSTVKHGSSGPAKDFATSSQALSGTPAAEEWLCQHPNCGRTFTHRHKLNRHRKCHLKPHKCLDPSCADRRVAFSLKKDLIRHQAKHNGRRFYCQNVGCRNALGGIEGGFTRKDNLQRHVATQHP